MTITELDNSAYSTGYDSNPYACEDTNDKIFLLSYREATNIDYGFNNDGDFNDLERRKIASDYSRATGAWVNDSGYGVWWLRSPDDWYDACSRDVGNLGKSGVVGVDISGVSYHGLVPAITILLEPCVHDFN